MFVIGATVSLLGIDRISSGAIKRALREGVRQFFPGYFALVMATGIVSTAAYLLNIAAIAWPLFVFNLVAYIVLWLVTLLRLVKFFPHLIADSRSDTTNQAFLTVVASTAVVGTQFAFLPLTPGEFRQSYWINMGATAIGSLAGSLLALTASDWIFLSDTMPFLLASALLLWAVSTWWIPLLVILEIRRYIDRRFPVRYDPRDWDIIFPLGMYAVATLELSKLSSLGLLAPVSWVFFGVAVLMWLIVCGGLLHRLAKMLILSRREEQAG